MSIAPPFPPLTDDSPKLNRREWGLLAVLAAVSCTQITDTLLLVPLAEKLQTDLQITAEQYSFVVSIYGFTAGVFGVLASAIVDKFCRKRYLLTVFAGLIGSILFTAAASSFWPLFFARFLAGAFGGLTACGALAVIGDLIPERRRGAALGALNSAFAFAAVIGMPAAFAVGIATGLLWPSFLVVALLGSGAWFWAAFKLPPVVEHKGRPRGNLARELWKVVSVRNHAYAFAFMLFVGLGAYCVINFMAQYMELNCGIPKGDFVVIFLVMGVCSLPAAVGVGRLTDRFGRRPVFVTMMVLMAVVTMVVVHLPPVSSVVAGAVAAIYMSVAVARLVPTHTIMMSAAKPELRGAYTTVYNSVSLFSTSLGPLIAGQIVAIDRGTNQMLNYPVAGYVGVAFTLGGIALSYFVRPAPAQPTQG